MIHDSSRQRARAAFRSVLLGLLVAAASAPSLVQADTLVVDDDLACPSAAFSTIQAAVDAAAPAGDTIQVCAGLYPGDVNVNKSVALRGAKAGVNPNDGAWNDTRTIVAAESTIRGAINLSLRNVIIVDGFTVERTNTNEGHFLIGSGNPTGVGAVSTFVLTNLRVVGTRDTPSPGSPWAGVHTNFLGVPTDPGGNFTIDRSRIQVAGTATGSGILINANTPGSDGLGQTTITNTFVQGSPHNGFNLNRPGQSATITGNRVVSDDIFTFRANNAIISGNTIIDAPQSAISNTGGSTNWTATNNTILTPRAAAVLVGTTFTVDPIVGATVSNNVVTVDPAVVGVGVTPFAPLQFAYFDLRGNLTGTTVVSDNTLALGPNALNPAVVAVYGVRVRGISGNPTPGNITVADNTLDGNAVGGAGAPGFPPSSGVWVDTDLVGANLNLLVDHDEIDGWVNGVSVYDSDPGAYGGLPAGAIVNVLRNDLSESSAFGVANGLPGAQALAECNWWGANDGPGPVGPGSGVDVTANVDYDPWLGSSNLDGQCPPDEDLDDVLDPDDLCPGTGSGDVVDGNGCSDEQVDPDGDGLCSPGAPSAGPSGCTDTDNCALVSNPGQENADGDAEGDVCDPDDDNDGVADTADNCPLDANTDQADFDGDGIGDVCDPQTIVQIDLRPRNSQNQVNQGAKQLVPIAILGEAGFDPNTDVDRESVLVRGASPVPTKFDDADVNNDGFRDLTLYFRAVDFAPPTPAECNNPNAIILLTGNFHPSGAPFEGTDRVSWQNCR